MTGIAVVASAHDAKFAEEVRAALQAAGLDASVSQSLPKAAGPHVVLIWSAALEAGHAIDAQALIGLWSEERLLVVRRDATPLPLGLRDLPSMGPEASSKDVAGAVRDDTVVVGSMGDLSPLAKPAASIMVGATEGIETTGSQEVELEFWRAIKDGNDPDDFELYVQQFPTGIYAALAKRKIAKLRGIAPEDTGAKAREQEKKEAEEAAKREAEVKQKLADEKAKLEAQLAAKEAGYAKREAEAEARRIAEADLKKKLAEAPKEKKSIGVVIGALVAIVIVGGGGWYYFNKSNLEKRAALTVALENATKATQELRQAHVRELEALKALEQARAAEDAARKAGDPGKLKEAQEAAKRAEAEAAKQAEAVKQREAAAADARKKSQESAASAKQAAAKASVPEKVAVAAVAPKAEAPKAVAKVPEPAAKAPEPVAEAPAPVAQAAEPPKAKTRSEREREEEDRLAGQVASRKGPPIVASVPSAAPESAAAAGAPAQQAADLFQQAQAMEASDPRGALRIYRSLARSGNGKAARRLGEIYDKGIPGIARDYAESLAWFETARKLGETIESSSTRAEATPAARPTEPEASAAVQPAPSPASPVVTAIPEVARPEPKSAAAKSAPPVREPAPAAVSEPPKAVAAAPPPDPAKTAAPPTAPAPERKSDWFSLRGLLIALLVLALIAWRRSRRREKALARQSRSQSAAATDGSLAQAAILIAALSESAKLDRAAIDASLRIVRECTKAAGGNVINTAGDRVMSSFPSADAAADAAIEMQAAVNALESVGNTRIGIRIGFNYGPIVEQADGDVFGDAVNVAARLSHVAVKGQIITARDTVMLMSPMLKSATRKITAIQIKGKAAEVEVYELMWQQSEDATTMAAARSVYKPKKTALKLVLRGKEHVLADEITAVSIGREEQADLVIEDPMASRSHGKIERRLDKFVLADHSANGTFVMVEGDREIVLRREEFTLRGRGWIAFGQSKTTATEFIEYELVPEQSVSSPDATLFVSYSHKDRSRVEPIVSVIEEMGRRVWMDRSDITGQTGWAGQIVRAIRECRAVVLMASPNSYNSDQVVRELYLAMNHRKTIVPIEIEPAEMPDELQYILAPFQHHRLSAGETRAVLGRALAAV